MNLRLTVTASLLLLQALTLASPAQAGVEANRVTFERWLRLEFRPVAIEGTVTRTLPTYKIDIPPHKTEFLEIPIPWPDPEHPGTLSLRVGGKAGDSGAAHVAAIESEWRPPDGEPFRASRSVKLEEGANGFVEVFVQDQSHLTLAVTLEELLQPVVSLPNPGRPVRFLLEVEKMTAGRTVLLETNELNTLVGESVEYSFRRGQDDTLEELRLRLRPLRIYGEIIEIEARFDGTLTTLGTPLFLSRDDRLMTSRDTATVFAATNGKPPTGYRFKITPQF